MIARALSVLAHADGFTLWHYRAGEDFIGSQYFDRTGDLFAAGDMVLVSGPAPALLVVERDGDAITTRPLGSVSA